MALVLAIALGWANLAIAAPVKAAPIKAAPWGATAALPAQSLALLPKFRLSLASECPDLGNGVKTRPGDADRPTEVSIGVYALDLSEIDDTGQSFKADFWLTLTWKDPRLAFDADPDSSAYCQKKLDSVWNPQAIVLNQRQLAKQFDDIVEINAEGQAVYRQRFYGELSAPLNLQQFPFDRQTLQIAIAVPYEPSEVKFSIDNSRTGVANRFSIVNWAVQFQQARLSARYVVLQDVLQERNFSRFDYELSARRNASFYIWKAIVPLSAIVSVAYLTFWLGASLEIAPLILSNSAVLSLIAYQFTLQTDLPQVPYLTSEDEFSTGSLVLVFLALGANAIASRLNERDNTALARRLTVSLRWLFPLAFAGLLAFAFWF